MIGAMLVVVAIVLAVMSVPDQPPSPEDSNGVLRSRAYKFKHITSRQAQETALCSCRSVQGYRYADR